MALPVVCALKMRRVPVVIQANVRIRSGAKIGNVQFLKGLFSKIKPYAFTEFARRYGEDYLLDCLERNEKNGVIYHREGINGDYDDFDDVDALIEYIKTGYR